MKKSAVLLLLSLSLPLIASFGQEFPSPQPGSGGGFGGRGGGGGGRGGGLAGRNGAPTEAAPDLDPATGLRIPPPVLPAFDLDFSGGTPGQLVAAIQKASGKPLNAIIPDEYAQKQLPAMKMKGVNVAKLFEALQSSSYETVPIITGFSDYGRGGGGGRTPNFTYETESYGFRTQGTPREDSIWYFHVDEPRTPAFLQSSESGTTNICRFYQLRPYLDEDYKVEDITTAIETGWKMLGVKPLPTLNFHKETKLLIAVGQPENLTLIDEVLEQLSKAPITVPPPPGPPPVPTRGLRPPMPSLPSPAAPQAPIPNAGADNP